MQPGPIEIDHPRPVSHHGVAGIGPLRLKVYGLLARDQHLTPEMQELARRFVAGDVLDCVTTTGDSNDLGFLIIHPGDLGLSVSAHWWVQGSVLCQHIYRRLHGAPAPMDTVKRPVIGCVWELSLIHFEAAAWRATMMRPDPSPEAYLKAFATSSAGAPLH